MAPKAKADAQGKAKAKKEKVEEEDVNRVEAPDRETFDAALQKISEAIEGFQKEQQGLTAKINERSGGKDVFFQQKTEFRQQLDEFSGKIDALMERKNEINKGLGDKRQEGMDMKAQLNKMKKSVGYTSEADIDDRIAAIEHKMVTSSISLKEEKELLKEISELKKRRPQVAKVKGMEESMGARDTGANLKEQIGIINDEMSQYRDGKRQVQEKMKALVEGRNSQVGDLSEVFEKRDGISKQIAEKIQERNGLRDEFRQKEREFNVYLKEQREKRQQKAMEERSERQAEYNMARLIRAAEKLDEQPYVQEITLIEQSIAFCKSLTVTKEAAKEEKQEVAPTKFEGSEVLASKKDRDEEFYFVPTAKKKSKSKAKGSKAEGGAKPIKHNAATFKLFDSLKLDAPITTDDIPATLEKLEAQLDSFKGKVKEWEEKREEMKKKILEGGVIEEEVEQKAAAEEEKKEE